MKGLSSKLLFPLSFLALYSQHNVIQPSLPNLTNNRGLRNNPEILSSLQHPCWNLISQTWFWVLEGLPKRKINQAKKPQPTKNHPTGYVGKKNLFLEEDEGNCQKLVGAWKGGEGMGHGSSIYWVLYLAGFWWAGSSSSQPDLLGSKGSFTGSIAHVASPFFVGSHTYQTGLVNGLQLSDRSLANVNACNAAQRWKTRCTQCSSLLMGSNKTADFLPLSWEGAHSGKRAGYPSWSQAAVCCVPSWLWINAGVSSSPFTWVLAEWYCDRALLKL